MAIAYPLALPTITGIRNVDFRAVNAVAYSASPFTFAGQAHAYPGQMWQAEITLPAMHRSTTETWIAFLMSLRGQYGTFLLGDPRACFSRGLASTFTGVPVVTAQTGSTINVTGASASKTGWLLAGDYIQIGTGANATLHKVLQDANTDAAGAVTLEVWPALRGSRTGVVSVTDTVGLFRLASNETGWSSNELANYGITFAAREAI
jgi:hypothetical protein